MKDGAHVTAKYIIELFPISATSLRYEPGPMQERPELLVPQMENDFTTDKIASTFYQGRKAPGSKRKSPKQESLDSSKKKALSVRKKTSKARIPTLRSFPILDQMSNLKVKVYVDYWNPYVKELSSRLWLPTETVSRASPLTLSSLSSSKVDAKSWFTVRQTRTSQNLTESTSSATTFWLSQHISQLSTMAGNALATAVNEHMVQEMNALGVSAA